MSCLSNIPSYARPFADSFKNNGHLEGEGVVRQEIPPAAFAAAEAQITAPFDSMITADETPQDLARGETGRVVMDQQGVEATLTFQGDTTEGCATLVASGGPISAVVAHGEFSDQGVDLVQVVEVGPGEYAAVGVHLDRQNNANSYVEMTMPEVFGDFKLFS